MLKQASDKEYAFIYYELFVQVKGGLQYYAVHVNIRLVCAAEGGVRSECYMYGTIYLFILEYQSGQPGGGIGTYAKLSISSFSLPSPWMLCSLPSFIFTRSGESSLPIPTMEPSIIMSPHVPSSRGAIYPSPEGRFPH